MLEEGVSVGLAIARGDDHRVVYANAAFARITGQAHARVVSSTLEAIEPQPSPSWAAIVRGATGARASPFVQECVLVLGGGDRREVRCSCVSETDGGVPSFALAVERLDTLEPRDAAVRAALEAVSDAVAIADARGRLVYANPAGREVRIGAFVDEPDAATVVEPDGAPVPPQLRPLARAIAGEATCPKELVVRFAGREHRSVVAVTEVVHDGARLFVVLQRGAEQRRALDVTRDEVLVRRHQLSLVGEMAVGVAHDLKNLLTPISAMLQVASRALDRGDLGRARAAAKQGQRLVERSTEALDVLRAFARGDARRMGWIDVNALVHDAARIAKPRVVSSGKSSLRLVEELRAAGGILGYEHEILRAVVNLVVNAIDAAPPSGSVVLRTGNDDAGTWIEVDDDGPGMPDDVRCRAFEPFFTTKGERGSGVGLAIVRGCAEHHHGEVTLDTAPGRGTRVRMRFPTRPPESARGKAG
ncbi:MAG TPA: ATP-binding protein [Minicystis sp.]|nr:ATP-binding protein [Minicystis sp.]